MCDKHHMFWLQSLTSSEQYFLEISVSPGQALCSNEIKASRWHATTLVLSSPEQFFLTLVWMKYITTAAKRRISVDNLFIIGAMMLFCWPVLLVESASFDKSLRQDRIGCANESKDPSHCSIGNERMTETKPLERTSRSCMVITVCWRVYGIFQASKRKEGDQESVKIWWVTPLSRKSKLTF